MADVCRGRHARLDREGTRVHEAHPRLHRAHPGNNVPDGVSTDHGAVSRLGETTDDGGLRPCRVGRVVYSAPRSAAVFVPS